MMDGSVFKKFCRNFEHPIRREIKKADACLKGEQVNMRTMRLKEEGKILPNQVLYPKKLILKQGTRHVLLDADDIVYCYSDNRVVFIVAADDQKYMADKNLLHLEQELDPKLFFKVNRTHVINFNFIRSFATYERNKIKVELKLPEKKPKEVVVSQTRVNAFRQWIYQQL
jgi:DNA-binding LytR/AlgR family response regulator